MSEETSRPVQLNINVDPALHQRLKIRSAVDRQPLTVLIPRLLRLALDHLQQEEQAAG